MQIANPRPFLVNPRPFPAIPRPPIGRPRPHPAIAHPCRPPHLVPTFPLVSRRRGSAMELLSSPPLSTSTASPCPTLSRSFRVQCTLSYLVFTVCSIALTLTSPPLNILFTISITIYDIYIPPLHLATPLHPTLYIAITLKISLNKPKNHFT